MTSNRHSDDSQAKAAPAAEAISDGRLIHRFREGSEEAAAALFDRYSQRLKTLAQRNLSQAVASRVDADDIVQSAFRCLFQAVRRGSYDLPSGEQLWSLLMVIALNRIRTHEEHHRAAKRDVRKTTGSESAEREIGDRPARPAAPAALMEMVIAEALERLPAHHRSVIQLRVEGYEVGEIATIVQRSKRTVERILQDAKAQLAKHLEEIESDDTGNAPVAGD